MKTDPPEPTSMRTPRSRPDLRLAESYVPGVIAWVRGIIYTSLCLLVQYGNIEVGYDGAGRLLMLRALPLVILYYDHIICSSLFGANTFVDCTAVATDVIAGTIAAQFAHLDYSCTSMWCWLIPLLWAVSGAGHIYNGDIIVPRGLSHIITASLVLLMFLFSKGPPFVHIINNATATASLVVASPGIAPYYARAASYLSFVVIDAYMLRPPLQREKDRIGLLRYGSVLFAPIAPLLACAFILLGVQVVKIYVDTMSAPQQQPQNTQQIKTPAIPVPKAFTSQPPIQHFPVTHRAAPTAVDALDVQEAFRLAKLHYMDGKASV